MHPDDSRHRVVNKRLPSRIPLAPQDLAAEPLSIREKLLAILRSDPLINGVVAAAITVGFLHGWLKIRFPHPATTFLFDLLLTTALVLVHLQQKRRESFIPPGPIGNALKGLYVLCVCYLLVPLPDRPPFIVSLAAVRGWCFATLMFSLGYRLTKSIPQVKGYFYVLILLGVSTAIYGLRQTPEEIQKQAQEDTNFAERYKFTYYSSTKGAELRVFSTFVSSGVFGGTMAFVTVFAIVLLSDTNTTKRDRWLLVAAVIPIAYAMVRSGARSALVSLICGFVVIAWHRRNFQNFVLIPAAVIFALKLGDIVSGGVLLQRYSVLLDFKQVYYRQAIPTLIGWDFMKDNLLGGGLGKSGYSVPFFLGYRAQVGADGDLGRLMIEMGIPGVICFGRIMWVTGLTLFRQLRRLRDTPVSEVALASAACVAMAFIEFPSGSPFLGIPIGAMVWFFLGTFMKLAEEHERGAFAPATAPAETAVPEKRFLYHRPAAKNGTRIQRRQAP